MPSFTKNSFFMAPTIAALGLGVNKSLSRGHKIRVGNKGSLSIDTKRNVFYDHESGSSGGVLKLIKYQLALHNLSDAFRWYSEHVTQEIHADCHLVPRGEPKQLSGKTQEKFRSILSKTHPASPTHPYIQSKGISTFGLRQHDNMLVLPIKTLSGHVLGIQRITSAGEKKFVEGSKTSGAFFSFTQKLSEAKHILICEGVATGATLQAHSNAAVVCAMSSGNLLSVSKELKNSFPNAQFTIAGDNDHTKLVNKGLPAAKAAARAIGAHLIFPECCGVDCVCVDFNDLITICKNKGANNE